MPTYSFDNKPLGLNLELDFENEPTKEDIYDVIKTQVDNKQIYDLIDGDEESKAFAIDAYRSGYFKEPEDDVDILDGIVAGAKSFGRGVGEIMVDNGVARSRLSDLAKASGGLKRKFSDDPFSYMMPEKAQWDEVAYSKEIDANLQRKIDKASVRVLDDSLSMDMPWDKEDAQNTLGIAMSNEGLPMDDPELRAEVSRRSNDLFKLKNRATLYQTISNYAGGYALLGSLAKREINQSDWLSSEQSDDDVIEELKHLRLQEQVMSVMENGAITGAQVVAHNNISDSNNIAEGIVRAGIKFFGGDKETAKRTEDALRKGLVSPDHDQALAMEVLASPENLATPLASMATQAGVRKFTSGQLRRLYNEYIPAKQSLEKATSELHNLRNGRAGQILSPESYKGIEDALVAEVKASRKITDKLGPKITDKFNNFSKPPLLRKGLGLMAGWAGKGIDTLGRTAQALRGMPKELAIDTLMKASKTLSPEDAEKLLYTLGGVGGIAYGGIQINNENWKPDYWDAIIGAGFLLGPRALRSTGTNLRHLGNYWTKSQGSKNLAQTIQQLDKRASISDALIDRSIESGYINTLKQSGKVFQEGISQGKNKLPLENIGSTTQNIARGATAIGADKVGDFLGRTAVTTAQGVALPGAIGYAIGGEEGMAGAIGPSLWFLGSGMVAGEFVRAKSLNDLKIKQRGDISNHVKGLSGTQADLYKRLTPENQAGVASVTQKFPDLEIQLIDDPDAGNGTYRFNGGQPVAIVNVSGDAPLVGALAHEVGHHITRHGLTPMVHEIFFGSHAKGKPGVFTALDKDNNPIVEHDASGVPRYKLNDEFDNIRNTYNEKLENTPGVDEDTKMEYATNPELILDEVVAEHVAHLMLNDQGNPGILNRNVGDLAKSLFSAISGKGFIRDAGVGLGLATDEFGNGLLPITENKDLSKLIKDFENLSSRRSKGEMGDMLEEDFSSDISVSPASLKDDRGLQRMFNNTLVLDANGNPELTISGLPKFMTNAQINKRNREMSSDLSDLIEGAGDLPNGHVKMSKSADGKMMGEGLFIDDSIINKLANSGKYTASQINFLKTSSTIGRQLANNDINGNEVLMFYYPATRGGRKYKSLKGGYRSALIWGIKVSKADNVYMQTLSLTAIEKNLSRMLKTKKYSKDLYDAFDGDSQIELRKSIREKFAEYLDNHHKGRSNDDGNNGITTKQKDILNALLGENVKAQSEANPYLKGLGFTPERSIKSRRLDRIGSLEVTGKGGFVDYYKMKQNHMPNVGRENPNQLTLFGTDELLNQNPNMSKIDQIIDPTDGLNFDKKYIKNLASKILDKVSLSTDDAGMLDGIGDNYAEQHGVLPSDLVGELYKQFFARSGYRMPRLRGLRDNVDLAIEKLGQEKFTTEQLESALKKVPGGIPYVKDLGLLYPPMEKLTRTQVMRDVEKNKLSFDVEELVGDKGRYTQHTDLQTPGKYDALDSIEFLTYFNGGGKYGNSGTISRIKEILVPQNEKQKVIDIYINETSELGDVGVKEMGKFSETKTGKAIKEQGLGEDKLDFEVLQIEETLVDHGQENAFVEFDKLTPQYERLSGANTGEFRNYGDLQVIDPKGHWQGRRNMAYWTRTTKRKNTHDDFINIDDPVQPHKRFKRVRHIEEIQSDWHKVYREQQQGKRNDQLPQPPMESNWYALALKEQLLDAYDSGLEQVSVTQGSTQNKRYDLSDVIDSIRIFDAEAEIGSGMKEGYTLQKHQDSIDRIMDLSAEVNYGDRETGLNNNNRPYKDVAKFDRIIELDLSNAGRQKFSIDADGNVISLLEGEMTEAVGKSLADIVGKNVADQVMSSERGKMLPEKLDQKVKILVEENFDVLQNLLKAEESQWQGILDVKYEDLPLPKDSNPEALNNRYNELLSSHALDVLGKKFKDQGIDIEDALSANERGDGFTKFSAESLSKVHFGDSEVLSHYYYKFRERQPISYHQGGILTNPPQKDYAISLYGHLKYENELYVKKDLDFGASLAGRIAEKNKKKGYMGQIKPDNLDYQDPAFLRFYDGAIRKTMDKFAKRMGVEKSKPISFDQNNPNAKHGWVIDLPKDRSTIENLGLYMPKLGKDEVVNFAEPVPLVKRSRSLQLKEKFKASSTDKLVDDLGNVEAELSNYLQPGEPLEVIPVESSNFAQKRNGLVEQVNDLKQVLSQRAMPRLNSDSIMHMPRTKDGEEYGMRHRPADRDKGNTMDDMSNIYPDDVYSPEGLRIYGDFPGSLGYHNQDMKALQAIRDARRNPDKKVKVYRAVDTLDGDEINPGDWVSSTKEYATGHGESQYGEYKILEKEVRANDLTTEGNSIHEWGYNPEIHKFMPLLGLPKASNVKYKDNQNLIPIVFKDISTLANKHVTFVEADRHDTDFDRMGGPLHAFLKSNDVVVSVDGATFRPQWANLKWSTLSGMINRVALTDEGHAMITLMHEDAHRSNKKMLSSILDGFESNRPNMSPDEIMVVSNAIRLIKERQRKGGKITKPQADFLKALGTYKSSVTSGKNVKENFEKIIKKYGNKDWWTDANTIAISKDFRSAHADTTFNARADIAKMFMRSDKTKSKNMPFAPDVDAMLFSQMDYHGGKKDDVVGVVQLSKHKLDSPDRVFGVYLGDDPKEARHMTKNELKVKEQLLADPNFKVHMSYDWLMLGPGDADFFMFEKPFDTNKILSTDYFNFHERSWRDKVTKLGRDYEKKWKRATPKIPKKNFKKYTKPSEDEQTDYKKFLAEKNKTPLILQGKSNKTGTYLRKGGFVPRVMK